MLDTPSPTKNRKLVARKVLPYFLGMTLALTPVFSGEATGQESNSFASAVSFTRSSFILGSKNLVLGTADAHMSSAPTRDCAQNVCVNIETPSGSDSSIVESTPTSKNLAETDIHTQLAGTTGLIGALSSTISDSSTTLNFASSQVDIFLNDETRKLFDPVIANTIDNELEALSKQLQPLATTAGEGALKSLDTALARIKEDPDSQPFLRIIESESVGLVESTPSASINAGNTTILLLPVDNETALFKMEISGQSLSASPASGEHSESSVDPGFINITLLPGLKNALPVNVGGNASLDGVPVSEILAQLPRGSEKILGENFSATDSALKLDDTSGGLVMEMSDSSDRACWFSGLFETCVEPTIAKRHISESGLGVGLVSQPARLGTLRQQIIVNSNQASAGINSTYITPDSSGTKKDQPLPETGSNLPPAWVFLLIIGVSAAILIGLRDQKSQKLSSVE